MRTTHHSAGRAALFGTAVLLAGFVPAFAEDTTSEITRLREEIRELDLKLRVLERQRELTTEQSEDAAASASVISDNADGFSPGSPDRVHQLRIRANIQADGRFHLRGAGSDTFLLRRVRPSFEGTIAKDFSFRVMPDFAGSSVTLVDAYIGYSFSPALNIQAGKFKVPFDLERLVSQTDLLFVERSYTTALSPNRDNGIHLFGDLLDERLSYNLAWVDGTADGGISISDNDSDKEIVARLFAHPFKRTDSALQEFGLGIAVTHGDKSGVTPAGYRTNTQQEFFQWRSGVTSLGSHTRVEPQAYYYNGPFGILGAWVSSRQELTDGTRTAEIENTGWFVAGSLVLTGEPTSYRAITPRRNFDPREGTWGAWEIALRFAQLDIDDDVFATFADPAIAASRVSSTTVGLNWYLNRNVKLVLNWEHSAFDRGGTGDVTRGDEDAILTRVQLRF